MNAQVSPTVEASRPAPANPMAVDPKAAMDRNALAAASSSSLAISGMRLSWAGSKNCLTPAFSSSSAYSPMIESNSTVSARKPTMTDWMRHVTTRIFLRSWRSTYTPASSPTTRLGTAVAMSVRPTARADPVSR